VAVALIALLAGGAVLFAEGQDLSNWSIEQERTEHEIEASDEVQIVNPWGAVNLRAGDGEKVVVSTVNQRHREDPRESNVYVQEIPSGLIIRIGFDDPPGVEERSEWQARRVDVGVFVPEGLAVSIRTTDNEIEVRNLVGRADLESTTGDITFRGGGGLRARSDSGSIFAQFHRSDWPLPVEIETRSGDIRAELLEGAAATAHVETRGRITTDFSIAIDRAAGSRLKNARATIGAGGQTLRLASHSGAVRLLTLIVPEESAD